MKWYSTEEEKVVDMVFGGDIIVFKLMLKSEGKARRMGGLCGMQNRDNGAIGCNIQIWSISKMQLPDLD